MTRALLLLALLATACEPAPAGGRPSEPLSGTVAGGRRMLLGVLASNGTIHWAGPTREDGSFAIEVVAPPRLVSLVAVDPSDPRRMFLARVELDGPTGSSSMGLVGARREALSVPVDVDAQTSADYVVRQATGTLDDPGPLLPDPAAAASAIAAGWDDSALCEGRLRDDGALAELAMVRAGSLEARFDAHAMGSGSLEERLAAAAHDISSSVTSSNQLSGLAQGAIVLTLANTLAVRAEVNAITGFEGGGFLPVEDPRDALDRQDLGNAALLILGGGAGNCREKGIAGAFAATRFPELRQVAIVAVRQSGRVNDHAVAVGCTGDPGVWSLGAWGGAAEGVVPPEAFTAGCYVIDPWTDRVGPLTPEYVAADGWQETFDVLPIDLGAPTTPRTPPAEPFGTCVPGEPEDPCAPFVLEDEPLVAAPPEATHCTFTSAFPNPFQFDTITYCYAAYGPGRTWIYDNCTSPGVLGEGSCPAAAGACRDPSQRIGSGGLSLEAWNDFRSDEGLARAEADCEEAGHVWIAPWIPDL